MAAVRQWLESRHIYTQNEWLEACINFVKEDNEERQLTSLQLNDLVYEQWLMADIQESSAPRLPEGLGNADVCKLEGYFNLQINYVLNVGESAYSQIQKMKGQDDPEELNWKTNPSEPKIKAGRMLLFELTDGTQTVFGMEYQLIPSLKVTTPPGTKIQVSGPTTCRLGALLLTSSNVKVLGGSVQVLEENSFWNVLHQAIGQDPTERPGVVSTETVHLAEVNVNQNSIEDNTTSDVVIYNNQRPVVKMEANRSKVSARGLGSNNQNFSECEGQFKQQGSSGRVAVRGVATENVASGDFQAEIVSNEDFFDDDDDLIAAMADEDYFGTDEDFDMEQINQLEQGMQNRNKTAAAKRKTTCSKMERVEIDDFEMLCGDDEDDDIFENDFITSDPPEDDECIEIKPLHQRIGGKDTSGAVHQSKRAKISNIDSVGFHNHSRVTSSSTSNSFNVQIQRESCMNSTRLPNVKADPVLQMSNSSNGSTDTYSSTNKRSNKHSIKSFSHASSQQMQHDGSRKHNSTVTAPQTSHPNQILAHCSCDSNSFDAQVTNLDSNAAPFMYLSEVVKHAPVSQECIIRVKAYIATIVSRSNPSSPNWNVIVKLNDGTDAVDADLSEKVLTELLEFPVDEFRREMQEAIKTRNTAVCQRLQKRTELFQRNLASTSCLMDLQFSVDRSRPRVLHLSQPTSTDVSAMLRHVTGLVS